MSAEGVTRQSNRPVTAECSSCGALMIFAKTVNGRSIPLDKAPSDEGTFALLAGRDGVPIALSLGALPEPVRPMAQLRQSHFASCPDADQHRRPRQ